MDTVIAQTKKRLDKIVFRLEQSYGRGCISWGETADTLKEIQYHVVKEFMEHRITKDAFIDDASFLKIDNFRIIKAIGQRK